MDVLSKRFLATHLLLVLSSLVFTQAFHAHSVQNPTSARLRGKVALSSSSTGGSADIAAYEYEEKLRSIRDAELKNKAEVELLRREIEKLKGGSSSGFTNPFASLTDEELQKVLKSGFPERVLSKSTQGGGSVAGGLAAGAVGGLLVDQARRESFGSIVTGIAAPRVMSALQSTSTQTSTTFPVS